LDPALPALVSAGYFYGSVGSVKDYFNRWVPSFGRISVREFDLEIDWR